MVHPQQHRDWGSAHLTSDTMSSVLAGSVLAGSVLAGVLQPALVSTFKSRRCSRSLCRRGTRAW